MARLVLGVLAVCVLWWCWLVFSDPASAAGQAQAEPPEISGNIGSGQLPIVPAKGKEKSGPQTAGPRGPGIQNGGSEHAGVAGRDLDGKAARASERPRSVPLRADFRTLAAARGDRRAEIARELLRQADIASDVPALLALLGEGNAFLHSGEGRQVARRTLVWIHREPPAQAVVHSTGLLNRCMRGPIGESDREAKQLVGEIYQRHKPLVRRVVCDPERLDGARGYRIKAGESLGQIASRARREGLLVEAHTLALVNRISNPDLVRAGQLLKIPVRSFKAVLEKRSFLMAIYLGDVLVRLYWVGHGADDMTPETTFQVGAKLEHPDWYAPDGNLYPYGHPKNVLGDYFVKFNHASYTGFGAHGTPDPASIGKMASQGCVRMRDTDIREFFRIMPQGCEVEVRATE